MKLKLRLHITFLLLTISFFIQSGQSQSYIFDGCRMPEYYEKYKKKISLKTDDDLIEKLKSENRFKEK